MYFCRALPVPNKVGKTSIVSLANCVFLSCDQYLPNLAVFWTGFESWPDSNPVRFEIWPVIKFSSLRPVPHRKFGTRRSPDFIRSNCQIRFGFFSPKNIWICTFSVSRKNLNQTDRENLNRTDLSNRSMSPSRSLICKRKPIAAKEPSWTSRESSNSG